jgi:hypothetical protein
LDFEKAGAYIESLLKKDKAKIGYNTYMGSHKVWENLIVKRAFFEFTSQKV